MDARPALGAVAELAKPKIDIGAVSPAAGLMGKIEGGLGAPHATVAGLAGGEIGVPKVALPDSKMPGDFSALEIPGSKPGNPDALVTPSGEPYKPTGEVQLQTPVAGGEAPDTSKTQDKPLRTAAELAMEGKTPDKVHKREVAADGSVEGVVPAASAEGQESAATGAAEGAQAPIEVAKPFAGEEGVVSDTAQADKDLQKHRQELQTKIKDGTATADEIKQFQKKPPAERQKELTEIALKGELTDAQAEELGKLNDKTPELTVDQAQEARDKEVEDLGTKIMEGLSKGEYNEEDIEKFRQLRTEQVLTQQGMSSKDARDITKAALKPEIGGRALAQEREIQARLQELAAYEMQLLALPGAISELKAARDKAKADITIKGNPVDPKGRMELNGLYMQLASIKGQMVQTKYFGVVVQAKYMDTMQYVRRKLGMSKGLSAVVEWAGAKVNNATTQMYLNSVSLNDAD